MRYTNATEKNDRMVLFGELGIGDTFLYNRRECRIKVSVDGARMIASVGQPIPYHYGCRVRRIKIVNVDYEAI